jgi:hypothetical protein
MRRKPLYNKEHDEHQCDPKRNLGQMRHHVREIRRVFQ